MPKAEVPSEVVFMVEEGKAMAKQVKTGLSSDTRIEILEGIVDKTVVVSGPYRALSKDLKHADPITTEQVEKKGRSGKRRKRKRH
ncbi:MAG: hypothetical protein JRJ87_23240 [Deltaproteobacteria bacterium]|nr:hypothetical protein [Deltaproteobacteria bacterium]